MHGKPIGDVMAGSVGFGLNMAALLASLTLTAVEQWLRVCSLCVGIAVGLATLYKILSGLGAKEKPKADKTE